METKELGKITLAEFGNVPDYPFLIGLRLIFEGKGWGVGNGGEWTINLTPKAWEKEPIGARGESSIIMLDRIQSLLKSAKVNEVSALVGKPVEVTFINRTFKSFRILEEVL